MSMNDVLSTLDSEISRLEQARALLTGTATRTNGKKPATQPVKAKRILSPEARERIANAQRKRWAAQKKAAK
jgi:hypothetical protein